MSRARNLGSTGRPNGPGDGAAADSAGQPWAGRAFEENSSAEDDGLAPAALMAALAGFAPGISAKNTSLRRCALRAS